MYCDMNLMCQWIDSNSNSTLRLPNHLVVSDHQGYRIAYEVLGSDRTCSNDPSRMRGQVQSEIR